MSDLENIDYAFRKKKREREGFCFDQAPEMWGTKEHEPVEKLRLGEKIAEKFGARKAAEKNGRYGFLMIDPKNGNYTPGEPYRSKFYFMAAQTPIKLRKMPNLKIAGAADILGEDGMIAWTDEGIVTIFAGRKDENGFKEETVNGTWYVLYPL